MLKLKALTTAVLITTVGVLTARPSLAQGDLNAQLQQAVCTQDWSQAIQVVDRMKAVVSPEYVSQLMTYRSQLESARRSGGTTLANQVDCTKSQTAVATSSVPAGVTGNRAFTRDYIRLAAKESDPTVRKALFRMAQTHPESGIAMAKQLCSGLRSGLSWGDLREIEARNVLPTSRVFSMTDYAIVNVLAPEHYCPEFASK